MSVEEIMKKLEKYNLNEEDKKWLEYAIFEYGCDRYDDGIYDVEGGLSDEI